MIDDEIVAEVRKVREKLAAKHGFDVKAIIAAARRRQQRSGVKTVSFAPATSKPTRRSPRKQASKPR